MTNRASSGIYELEQDAVSKFRWLSRSVAFGEELSDTDQQPVLEVPAAIAPLACTMQSNNGIVTATLAPGIRVLDRNIAAIDFAANLDVPGESRKLTAKLRLLPLKFERDGYIVTVDYDLSAPGGAAATKVTITSPRPVAGYYDLIYQRPADSTLNSVTWDGGRALILTQAGKGSLSLHIATGGNEVTLVFDGTIVLDDVMRRAAWNDFYQLESRFPVAAQKQAARDKSLEVPKFVQWYVTWKCNYTCQYCWQESNPDFYRNAPITKEAPEVWANAFNKLAPRFLYLTGGEPTLYKKLPEMLSMIDPQTKLIMTSNLGFDLNVDRFVNLVRPSQFAELMVSYHPTQVDREVFAKRIRRLVESGFTSLGVEMVLAPSNLGEIDFLNALVADCGLQIRYDEFHPVRGSYTPSEQEAAQIAKGKRFAEQQNAVVRKIPEYAEAILGEPVDFNKAPPSDSPDIEAILARRDYVYCAAGSRKITVDGLGDVYACTSAIDRSRLFGKETLPHYQVLGNLFAGTFDWMDQPFLCGEAFRCSACDYQPLAPAWVALDGLEKYPLPE